MERYNNEFDGVRVTILKVVLGLILLATFALVVTVAADRQEVVRCEQLLSQSQHQSWFYVTYTEHVMCSGHGYEFIGTFEAPILATSVPDGQLSFAYWCYHQGAGKWQMDTPLHYDRDTDPAYVK